MVLGENNSKSNNVDDVTSDFDIDKIQLLSRNQKIKSLVKQIMDKLARNKKYKQNSVEMLNELKNELIYVLNKQKKNETDGNIG